ncbi:HIT family protein [Paucibacter sp. AS339]|uniref:HIT family protein n=1 Tax=Paucibacter hankyongi TaxID=3133434 RepID=UPI0030957508
MTSAPECPLCRDDGGLLILQTPQWRVIRAEDAQFPAFYRLVWQAHVAEFSELSGPERLACMEAVTVIERVLREALRPTKINLAALGNVVPHLHWHVVARFDWDSHFPNPIWGVPMRGLEGAAVDRLAVGLSDLDERVRAALSTLLG